MSKVSADFGCLFDLESDNLTLEKEQERNMTCTEKNGSTTKYNFDVRDTISECRENELIMASDFYKTKLQDHVSEPAFYKTLQRMHDCGEIEKVAKGIYYIPKKSKYGVVQPTDKDIIETFAQGKRGMVVGYALYNYLNLTTQVPKVVQVLSNVIDGQKKTIRNVVIQRVSIEFSDDVVSIIQCMEVLQNFAKIQDINRKEFIRYTQEFATGFKMDAFERVIAARTYKKATVAFLRDVLDFYHVPNTLGMYLSSMSNYKYPRMEELHETT